MGCFLVSTKHRERELPIDERAIDALDANVEEVRRYGCELPEYMLIISDARNDRGVILMTNGVIYSIRSHSLQTLGFCANLSCLASPIHIRLAV